MDTSGNGRRGGLTTSALVSVGGVIVAAVTGVGLWFGHEQASTTEGSTSETQTSTDTQSSTDTGTATDQGVTQGGSSAGDSDATTTGS
ncbi:hypothetical protein SAMN05660766_1949 [Curtobacterium sp. 314Chir4.1]|jgi:hypothetical protein|uniref:hypothetical protein n=1 Tax=Curtobacterium sp. 314Chir4.1 TaxID=1279028 RepID=UPI000BD4B82C|nr:hypothetical protein [Curtobacterium sp. 314Chir4.1]SOC88249.1 hypothetical protein SAMN05660766_1949 [Curtobacterium sp. 314Chir4.1]